MKYLKPIALLFVMLITIGQLTAQQNRMDPEEMAKKMTEQMKDGLDLTEDQLKLVTDINQDFATQMSEAREATSDRDALRGRMRILREKNTAKLKEVLTETQFEKLKELRKEQKGHGGRNWQQGNRAKSTEYWAEIRTYYKETILPVMKAQRAKLEQDISEADKAGIEEARKLSTTLNTEIRNFHKEVRGTMKSREDLTEEEKSTISGLMDQKKSMHAAIKGYAEKYQAQIASLLSEIDGDVQLWKSDMEEICASSDMENPGRRSFADVRKRFGPRTFILLNPDSEASEFTADILEAETREMNVFPNPASTSNTIQFDVKEAGNVRIDLLNKDGNLVRNIMNEVKEPGSYTVTVATNDLNGSIYYYLITDKSGKDTRKFIVNKID